MRTFCLTITTLIVLGGAATPARADIGPPDNECTVSWQAGSSRECVSCQPTECATTVPEGFDWVCDNQEPPLDEVWCGPRSDDGGCGASVSGGKASGRTTALVLLALFAVLGLALYRRVRSRGDA